MGWPNACHPLPCTWPTYCKLFDPWRTSSQGPVSRGELNNVHARRQMAKMEETGPISAHALRVTSCLLQGLCFYTTALHIWAKSEALRMFGQFGWWPAKRIVHCILLHDAILYLFLLYLIWAFRCYQDWTTFGREDRLVFQWFKTTVHRLSQFSLDRAMTKDWHWINLRNARMASRPDSPLGRVISYDNWNNNKNLCIYNHI